jgi:predicted AlkP superfamily pyrophosphatase or phosphodiesterase
MAHRSSALAPALAPLAPLLVLVVLVGAIALAAAPAAARPARGVRLGVVVIFDQLRVNELERYEPFFGPGGFGGLASGSEGARYDVLYGFASTETGPGHATLATGTNPDVHGIATNTWYVGAEKRYAVEDPATPVHGATDKSGRSARMLVAPTLGDAMKAESAGRARVVTLSHKDRSAILSAGRSGDIAVWYDSALGRYTSSAAYVDALPPWLAEKGASLPAASQASARWSPLPVPAGLEHLVPVDDRPGEGAGEGMGAAFPHDIAELPEPLRRKHYRLMPQSMDDLFALALAAVEDYGLGEDAEPDLLVVSVSTTDYVGHNFGPDSLEQLDLLRRADQSLRRFRAALSARLPARSVVLAVTSDHGAPPLPAAAEGQRFQNGIIPSADLVEAAELAAARAAPGGARGERGERGERDRAKRILGFSPPQLYVDTSDLPPDAARRVLDAVIAAVEAIPGIANVYDFSRPAPDEDAFAPLMRAASFPGRTAPLFVRQEPRVVFLINREKRGTDHGTPYLYDRRVPLMLAGPGVRRGRYAPPADARDVAATLAFLMGVPPPDMCQGVPVSAVGD